MSWELMSVKERAQMVLSWFPTLERDNVQNIMREWATGEYPSTPIGEDRAISDLMIMLRTASMTEEQKAQERLRTERFVKENS